MESWILTCQLADAQSTLCVCALSLASPFFPQLHHIQSVQLSTFFVLFLFRCFFVSRIGNVWTLHLQSKIDSTDQTVEHDQEVGWRLCCASAFGLFWLDSFDEKKVLWKGLGLFLGFSRFKHQRYGQVAQCEGIPGFGLAWCCWQFWSPETATKMPGILKKSLKLYSSHALVALGRWIQASFEGLGRVSLFLLSALCSLTGVADASAMFSLTKTCVDCLLQFGNLFFQCFYIRKCIAFTAPGDLSLWNV